MQSLGAFARELARGFSGWQSAEGEGAYAYFNGDRSRHYGDESNLRDSLVKARTLCGAFGYPDTDVEVEAHDRADLVV